MEQIPQNINTKPQRDEAEEFRQIIDLTDQASNQITKVIMEKLGITDSPETFDLNRYKWLKRVCQRLSRDERSVDMINGLLKLILCVSDAWAVREDEEALFDCVHTKFIIVSDLAQSCKVTTQNLLQHAKQQIYSNITFLYSLNSVVGWLI